MSDIEKGRINRPRDEGVFVSRVESEKKDKTPFVQLSTTGGSKRLLVATFLNSLKRLFDALSSSEEEGNLSGKIIEQQTVLETLLAFKNLLLSLCKEDFSQNATFAQELSDHWIKLQDDFEKLHLSERKGSPKVAIFRRFLDQLNHYPEKADHSLGYYLLEHSGKDWLPFPFIEMLLGLHNDYKLKGESSTLSQWIRHIEELSQEIRGKLPL